MTEENYEPIFTDPLQEKLREMESKSSSPSLEGKRQTLSEMATFLARKAKSAVTLQDNEPRYNSYSEMVEDYFDKLDPERNMDMPAIRKAAAIEMLEEYLADASSFKSDAGFVNWDSFHRYRNRKSQTPAYHLLIKDLEEATKSRSSWTLGMIEASLKATVENAKERCLPEEAEYIHIMARKIIKLAESRKDAFAGSYVPREKRDAVICQG